MRAVLFAAAIFAVANALNASAGSKESHVDCGPMIGASATWIGDVGERQVSQDGFEGQVFRIAMPSTGDAITITRRGGLPGPTDRALAVSGNVADGWSRVSYVASHKSVDRLFTLFIPQQESPAEMLLSMTESQIELGTGRPQVRAYIARCGPVGSRD